VQGATTVTASGEKTSFNVGRIGGGTSINSIAFESWMEIDMRSGDQAKLDEIDAVLQRAVDEALAEENAARKEDAELTVDVKRVGTRPAARGDRGLPAITMSRGGISEDSHSPAESWQNKDGHLAIQIGLLTLLAEAGYANE